MAMHLSLSTNFSFRRFDLVLGPSLHRLPPQQPHLLHDPLLDRIGLLEVSLAVLYRPNYRRESISKTRVRLETGQNRLVAKFRGRHLLKSHPFPNPNLTPHHFESHPIAGDVTVSCVMGVKGYSLRSSKTQQRSTPCYSALRRLRAYRLPSTW